MSGGVGGGEGGGGAGGGEGGGGEGGGGDGGNGTWKPSAACVIARSSSDSVNRDDILALEAAAAAAEEVGLESLVVVEWHQQRGPERACATARSTRDSFDELTTQSGGLNASKEVQRLARAVLAAAVEQCERKFVNKIECFLSLGVRNHLQSILH